MPFPVHAAKIRRMFVDIIAKKSLNTFDIKHENYTCRAFTVQGK